MQRTVTHTQVVALAFTLALGFAGCAKAQLYTAIAPEARTLVNNGPSATFFISAINDTSQTLTQCRPVIGTMDSYQTVDATNQLTGSANTPTSIAPGATQGFLIAFDSPNDIQSIGAQLIVPSVECSERASEPSRLQIARLTSIPDGFEAGQPDIIAIGVTPSGDGIVRVPQAGGVEVLAVAAVNIGSQASVRVNAYLSEIGGPISAPVCETGTDGACLAPPESFLDVTFEADEVKTFSLFPQLNPDRGLLFAPDAFRVGVRFSVDTGREFGGFTIFETVGQATAAITAPAPENFSDIAGVYASRFNSNPEPIMIVLPDGRTVIADDKSLSEYGLPPEVPIGLEGFGSTVRTTNETVTDASADTPAVILAQGVSSHRFATLNNNEAFEYAAVQGNLAITVQARSAASFIFAPNAGTPSLPATQRSDSYAASFWDNSLLQTPLAQLAGNWTPNRLNEIAIPNRTLTIEADGSFRGEIGRFGNACEVTGIFEDFPAGENYFAVRMQFNPEQDDCGADWGEAFYSGAAFVLSDERPLNASSVMRVFMVSESLANPGSLNFYLFKD